MAFKCYGGDKVTAYWENYMIKLRSEATESKINLVKKNHELNQAINLANICMAKTKALELTLNKLRSENGFLTRTFFLRNKVKPTYWLGKIFLNRFVNDPETANITNDIISCQKCRNFKRCNECEKLYSNLILKFNDKDVKLRDMEQSLLKLKVKPRRSNRLKSKK